MTIHPRDNFKPTGITRAQPIEPKPIPTTPADRDWCCARCGAEGALCPACHEIVYETPSAEEVAEINATSEAWHRGELETVSIEELASWCRGRDEAMAELAQSDEWKAFDQYTRANFLGNDVNGEPTCAEWEALRKLVEESK